MSPEFAAVASRWHEAVRSWCEFRDEVGDELEEYHFDSLAIGFFLGKDVQIDDAILLSIVWDQLK